MKHFNPFNKLRTGPFDKLRTSLFDKIKKIKFSVKNLLFYILFISNIIGMLTNLGALIFSIIILIGIFIPFNTYFIFYKKNTFLNFTTNNTAFQIIFSVYFIVVNSIIYDIVKDLKKYLDNSFYVDLFPLINIVFGSIYLLFVIFNSFNKFKGSFKIFWIIVFCLSMGFLEGAIVIYLRELYYPLPVGFKFPLVQMPFKILNVELLRELATILMLIAIAYLADKKNYLRLAWFIICFAIWDLVYYLVLYVFLNWPNDLLVWDILFLLPIPWFGPVLTPVLIAILMIIFGSLILYFNKKNKMVFFPKFSIYALILGCLVILYTFTDYKSMAVEHYNYNVFEIGSKNFVPVNYSWTIFIFGILLLIFGVIIFVMDNIFTKKSKN